MSSNLVYGGWSRGLKNGVLCAYRDNPKIFTTNVVVTKNDDTHIQVQYLRRTN
jgi:hypothetical protein